PSVAPDTTLTLTEVNHVPDSDAGMDTLGCDNITVNERQANRLDSISECGAGSSTASDLTTPDDANIQKCDDTVCIEVPVMESANRTPGPGRSKKQRNKKLKQANHVSSRDSVPVTLARG
ncbi:hypothetical protein BVRB_032590, partial [Beta vulgaris subsp. vulgaris]